MKVSVLMPVHNAASTLETALESIAGQTYRDIELIVCDDCSTDSSEAILKNFQLKFESVEGRTMKICRHDNNRGVAAARNTALDTASGEWICWVDADDTIALQTIEKAVESGIQNKADIVGWDWTLVSSKGNRYMRQPDCKDTTEALKALMGGTLRWNLWLFMARKSLYDGIRFIPGMNMGEDMMAMLRLFLKCAGFAQTRDSFYNYRQTSDSISRTMTESNLMQVCANLDKAEEVLLSSSKAHLSNPYLSLLKLNVKLPLLVSTDKNDYLRWFECYPESHPAIMLNRHLPLRTKILQKMAAKRLWWAVKLYNKAVYGLLYKLLWRKY